MPDPQPLGRPASPAPTAPHAAARDAAAPDAAAPDAVTRLRYLAYLALIALTLALTPVFVTRSPAGPHLGTAQGLVALCALVLAARGLPLRLLWPPALLVACSGILLWLAGAPAATWLQGVTAMVPIWGLVALVLPLAVPLTAGGYTTAVSQLLNRSRTAAGRYRAAMGGVWMLHNIATLGGLPLAWHLLRDAFKPAERRELATAMLGGQAVSLVMTPIAAPLALTLMVTRSSLAAYFLPTGLVVAGATAAACWLALPSGVRRRSLTPPGTDPLPLRRFGGLLTALLVLAGAAVLLERAGLPGLGGTAVAAIALGAGWSVLLGCTGPLRRFLRHEWLSRVDALRGELVLWIAVGLLGAALQHAGAGQWLSGGARAVAAALGPGAIPVAIALAMLLLALVGLHPFVFVLLVGPLAPELGLPGTLMAGALVAGFAATSLLAPFTASVLIVAGLARTSPLNLVYRWALRTGLSLLAALVAALAALAWWHLR